MQLPAGTFVDDDVVRTANPGGSHPVVLVCEHASFRIPPQFHDLGLQSEALTSHIAWDPGAMETAQALSGLLDAPLATRAAVFFHGRESVIPQMFLPLAEELERSGTRCDALLGYLHRHVEVDGDAHGPAAQRLLHELYVSDSVELSALRAAKSALEARRALWDATLAALPRAHTTLRA